MVQNSTVARKCWCAMDLIHSCQPNEYQIGAALDGLESTDTWPLGIGALRSGPIAERLIGLCGSWRRMDLGCQAVDLLVRHLFMLRRSYGLVDFGPDIVE